jgi:hypothetical protein
LPFREIRFILNSTIGPDEFLNRPARIGIDESTLLALNNLRVTTVVWAGAAKGADI